jgi:hypothetical protein
MALFTCSVFAQQKEGELKIESSGRIDEVIEQKKKYNKSLKTIKGYRIQLFYGNEKESYKIRDEFKKLFPEISTIIIFSSPQWKVQVGNFKTRLEADRTLVDIKIKYPAAIILATEIDKEQ